MGPGDEKGRWNIFNQAGGTAPILIPEPLIYGLVAPCHFHGFSWAKGFKQTMDRARAPELIISYDENYFPTKADCSACGERMPGRKHAVTACIGPIE
jgi:hypothetical protein